MSGAEAVAGLAIGVLPLLVSAVEHYRSVCRPFRRWRNFHEESRCLDAELLVEKVKFHNECRILLGLVVGHNDAGEMLENPKHPLWKDVDLEAKMSSYLGDSASVWGLLIEMIDSRLEVMKEKIAGFSAELRKSKETKKKSGDVRRSKTARKLEFSISGPALSDDLSELRLHNQSLRRLSDQVQQLFIQSKAMSTVSSSQAVCPLAFGNSVVPWKENSSSSSVPINQCRLIQKAAIKLHNSLTNACKLHPEHSACFRLNSSQLVGTKLVRFDMMLGHTPDKEIVDEDPIWFAVESVLKECLENPAPVIQTGNIEGGCSDSTKAGKHCPLSSRPKEGKNKTVTFAKDDLVSANVCTMGEILPNLSQHRDFCRQLRKWCMQKPALGRCLGYLDRTEVCDHRVVFSQTSAKSKNPTSLAHLISSWSNSNGQGIMLYQGLCLAKQLASAVLRFHATPLLKEDWASDDVVFFYMESSSSQQEEVTLAEPHLSVRIQTKTQETRIAGSANRRNLLVRNPYTFTLGLVLIELGYQAPLQSVPNFGDCHDMRDSFSQADLVSREMSTQLGVSYKRIVQQCIHCDFGAGFDLTEPKLQVAFHRDIICGLEKLERRFKDLQING